MGEFDFRYNTRKMPDMARAMLAAEGIKGKRLTISGLMRPRTPKQAARVFQRWKKRRAEQGDN